MSVRTLEEQIENRKQYALEVKVESGEDIKRIAKLYGVDVDKYVLVDDMFYDLLGKRLPKKVRKDVTYIFTVFKRYEHEAEQMEMLKYRIW